MMRKPRSKKKTYKFLYTIKGEELSGKDLPVRKMEIKAKTESEAWKKFRKQFFLDKEYCLISFEQNGK